MYAKKCTLAILIALATLYSWGEQRVVPAEVAENDDFKYAVSFLERYKSLISGPQDESIKDSIRRVKEDGFRYIIGNDNIFRNLSGNEDFSISFSDGVYKTGWSTDGAIKVACTFPANIGLLTFSNKIELEENFLSRLKGLQGKESSISRPVRLKKDLKPVILSDFFVDDKGFYITPRLRHQLIFSSVDNEKCELLIDTVRYQLESLANMMLSGFSDSPKQISLKISQYGYKFHTLDLDFAQLFDALSSEGCTPYWGIDTYDGKTVKGLYIWLNPSGGYAHLLSVTVPIGILSNPEKIDAKLHCYLRLDNLKSMFEEYPEI